MHNDNFKCKELAHDRVPILCLDFDQSQLAYADLQDPQQSDDAEIGSSQKYYFVSGGQNGVVIVWSFMYSKRDSTDSKPFEKHRVFSLLQEDEQRAIREPTFHIQSLQLKTSLDEEENEFVLAGTRNGDIYYFHLSQLEKFPDENHSGTKHDQEQPMGSDKFFKIYSCHDNEIPKVVNFSADNKRIYCITENGLFSGWQMQPLKLVKSYDWKKPTVAMIVLQKNRAGSLEMKTRESNLEVIIAFKTEIKVFDTDHRKWCEVKDFCVTSQRDITDVKVSEDENIMAVAYSADGEANTFIEIFKIDFLTLKFTSTSKLENISSAVEFMDFSVDNKFLLYKDKVNQKCYYEFSFQRKSDPLGVDTDIEWMSDGIKLSEKTSELDKQCEDDNTFRCMVKVVDKSGDGKNDKGKKGDKGSIIVTDDIGTVDAQ